MLARLPDALVSQMTADTNAAVALLEGELARNGIEVVRDGELFVRFLPKGWQTSPLAAQLARIKSSPSREDASAASAMPAGTVDFRGVDINQYLLIYSELCGRTVLRPRALGGLFSFRTETRLSREEVVYALNVVLALNGFAAVEDGEKFVQVVPIPEADSVKTHAPKAKPLEPLIMPGQAPVLPSGRPPFPLRLPPGAEPPAGQLSPPPLPPHQSGVDDLVAYYAKLTGQKFEPSQLSQQLLYFRVKTPLTKAEMLYAIETTLALSGLAIVPGDEGTIRAGKL